MPSVLTFACAIMRTCLGLAITTRPTCSASTSTTTAAFPVASTTTWSSWVRSERANVSSFGPDPRNWSMGSASFSGTLTREGGCDEAEALHGRTGRVRPAAGGGGRGGGGGLWQDGRLRGDILPVEEAVRRHGCGRDP